MTCEPYIWTVVNSNNSKIVVSFIRKYELSDYLENFPDYKARGWKIYRCWYEDVVECTDTFPRVPFSEKAYVRKRDNGRNTIKMTRRSKIMSFTPASYKPTKSRTWQ